jgi:hypothetical protein
MFARPAKTGLDLVRDEQAAGPLDRFDRALQEACRIRMVALSG